MHKDCYPYLSNANRLDFEFESKGRNGKIKKEIRYTLRNENGFVFYNLGFGDLNPQTGEINDLSISDNQDRDRILATVASTVLEFTKYFPDALVFATGSTPARTRLYQMALSANLKEINQYLRIFGSIEGSWYEFEKNVNYDAFLVLRR